ncbi:amino acid ABC transporter permease [Streptomyces sp. NPDC090306]|uniref:amino acid ABC transporter permease n=1 Tax=Streptomyces sp. NPDC090306 TaxID=3365961 RepID=UPI003800DA9F
MAWAEWERLKADAAQRLTAHTQLNSLPAEDGYATGGGADTLKHKGGPWTKAAATADGLRTTTDTCAADIRTAHEGTDVGLEGLAGLAALKSVLTSWEHRLKAVREECDSLGPKLRQVAVDLGEVDAEVAARSKTVTVPETTAGR